MQLSDFQPAELMRLDGKAKAARLVELEEEIHRRALLRLRHRLDRLVGELNRRGHELSPVEADLEPEFREVAYRDDRDPRFSVSVSLVAVAGHGDEA